MSQGRKVRQQLDKVQEQARVGRHTHEPNARGGGVAEVADLPRKYQLRDKEWANLTQVKQDLLSEAEAAQPGSRAQGMTKFGQMQLTDRDLRALAERRKVDAAQAFDGWFGKNFNVSDLPTRLLGEELNPEYYKERENALIDRAQMALRLELMKLYGPRSEEDLILIYGLENNLIRLDTDSLNIETSEGFTSAAQGERVKRFNNAVSRFLRSDAQNRDEPIAAMRMAPQPFERAAVRPSGRQYDSLNDLLGIF